MTEIWKPIPMLDNLYEASNKGTIRDCETKRKVAVIESCDVLYIHPKSTDTIKDRLYRIDELLDNAFNDQI